VHQLVDAADLVIQWYSASSEGRQEIIRILQREVARTGRHWHFHPISTDRCLVIGQSTLDLECRARALGLVFLALPSTLIVGAAALGVPGPHLMILSLFISLVSMWMMARVKVQRLSEKQAGYPGFNS
jgi:hypothetical protein